MSNELSIIEQLNIFMEGRESKFVTLNETVNPLNFAAECDFARQALMKNEYLLNAARNNQQSLADAISNVGAIGISLNPANKHAYLVPRKIGQKNSNGKEILSICLDISYMGMIKLATDTGVVKYMKAELVYENDEFTYHGFDRRPEIAVKNPFDTESRGNLLGCIAWAKLKSGDYLNEFMTLADIDKIRDDSQAYKSAVGKGGWTLKNNVWVKHEGEMQKKTVIKRLYKTLPVSDGSEVMSHAINVLNQHEGIEFDQPKEIEIAYTLEESNAYEKAIEVSDFTGLISLVETLSSEAQPQLWKLHHTPRVEKGGIGRYDKMMEENFKVARDMREDNLVLLVELIEAEDHEGISQIFDECNQYEQDWYMRKLDSEKQSFINQAKAA